MNTTITEENLYVISDIHLGNPLFDKGKSFSSFLDKISKQNASLCINGDGVDLLMMSFPKLMLDLPLIIKKIQKFVTQGENEIYYVIGNHDIYLESFLEDSGFFNVVPFLDVISGDRRIHIEHGHLYDSFFINHTQLYIHLTKLLGLVPRIWHQGDKSIRFLSALKNRINRKNAPNDNHNYIDAATELFGRGFDTVIFGHTHHLGNYVIENNKNYVNAGSWIGNYSHYIEIIKGGVDLKEWR